MLCNASLQRYGGDLFVGVMTVINSVREVISMPITGITNGCQPVLGYNYGAKKFKRVAGGDSLYHGSHRDLCHGGMADHHAAARGAHPHFQ